MLFRSEGGATPAGPAPAGGWWSQFGPNGPVAVRQASVCGATNMACATIGSPPGCSVSCPAPSSCAWGWEPVPDDDVDGSALSVLGPYDCGTGPCAHDALPSSFDIPWTLSPQPATGACTECWFNLAAGANRLHLVMNPELPLVRYDARLVLFSAGGTRLGVLDLASLPWGAGVVGDGLSPGDLLDISSLPTPPASASKARLDVRVAWGGGNWSMMSEVPILW